MSQELTKEGRGLSLFEIEKELAELVAAREEAATSEEAEALDNAIKLYIEGQVRKVDGVRAYIRNCEVMTAAAREEAQRQTDRARAWENKGKNFKRFVLDVMQNFGLKKLEGSTGTLTVCPTGGPQPVVVSDASLVPDEYIVVRGEIAGPVWNAILEACPFLKDHSGVRVAREISLSLVGEALATVPVPGAHLEPRGVHLRVK